ncbi:hypothetical protein FLA_1857 [Filimonas lacunae]|nr:hypothetical protein FLA_1857 [Filimonas lacunae]
MRVFFHYRQLFPGTAFFTGLAGIFQSKFNAAHHHLCPAAEVIG